MIHELDLKGLRCPISTVKLKRFLKGVKPGEIIRVKTDDEDARVDFPALIKSAKDDFVSFTEEQGIQVYEIMKK